MERGVAGLRGIESDIAAIEAAKPTPLGELERRQLMRLGADLELAWSHPAATSATRKRIVRAVINEIVVRIDVERIEMVLHWQGGDHTALKLKKNGVGKHRWTIPEIRCLSFANWRGSCLIGKSRGSSIALASRQDEAMAGPKRGCARSAATTASPSIVPANGRNGAKITLEAAAQIMEVSVMTALRMIQRGVVNGRQICRGAPWAINADDVAAYRARQASQRPPTGDPAQQAFDFR